MSHRSLPRHVLDNRANQLNPEHPAYYQSRGISPDQASALAQGAQAHLDNHANQLNPTADAFRQSREQDARPVESTGAEHGRRPRSESK